MLGCGNLELAMRQKIQVTGLQNGGKG
jgi:hypothetical protein